MNKIITPETGAYSHKDVLFYDTETTYLTARIWRPGEQVVRANQLFGKLHTDIICITYCYGDGEAHSLDWGAKKQNSKPIVLKFDSIIRDAKTVIGKNSDRFDNKHLNTLRLLNNHQAMPEWTKKTEDLEKLLRRYFNLPSYSLDYVSRLLGLGGKNSMEFDDWVNIIEHKCPIALQKMITYGLKDVVDTRAIWHHAFSHFITRTKAPAESVELFCCVQCGSAKVTKNGTRKLGHTIYQQYFCQNHHGYAGKKPISSSKGSNLTI